MIKFYNRNESFGACGPFRSESKEALADAMMPIFEEWYVENTEDSPSREEYVSEVKREFIAGLEAQWHGEPRIVFDKRGGIILQLPGYTHRYDNVDDCADDIRIWLEAGDTDDWEGNEEEEVFYPVIGEYDIFHIDYFLNLGIEDVMKIEWMDARALYVALSGMILLRT